MKKAVHLASILMAAMFSPPSVAPAGAEVLCQKRSGVVVVRTACKKKEVALDLAQFGAVGPKGDPGDTGPRDRSRACPRVAT